MEKQKPMLELEADIIAKVDEAFISALECVEDIERSKGKMYVVDVEKPIRIETAILNAQYHMGQYHSLLSILESLDLDVFVKKTEANSQYSDRILNAIGYIYSLREQNVQQIDEEIEI